MARPRIFVSSTFYDLKQIRTDLEVFIKQIGYEPVMYERGHVPYGRTEKLETYCYSEAEHCDILVSVIGGRYGTASARPPHSISQTELLTALKAGKQVYIFIDKNVYAEYRTYLMNKGAKGTRWHFADNEAVYEFIEQCENLPNNNQIHGFESSQDIIAILREQWAGLLQRYLMEDARKKHDAALQDIEATARTLKDMVKVFMDARRDGDKHVRESIMIANHPVFARLRKLLNVQYRVFFTNRKELDQWLDVRGYESVPDEFWDAPGVAEWMSKADKNPRRLLKIPASIFDEDGALTAASAGAWDDESVKLADYQRPDEVAGGGPDDIPF